MEVTQQRTRQDWARFVRDLLDVRYAQAERVVLVMDNLNTHSGASLYETFPAEEALRLLQRLEIHYTPKHGSWLNMAEGELSVLQELGVHRESVSGGGRDRRRGRERHRPGVHHAARAHGAEDQREDDEKLAPPATIRPTALTGPGPTPALALHRCSREASLLIS